MWHMWKVFSYFSPGVFYSRFSMQIGNLHLLKKCGFFAVCNSFCAFGCCCTFERTNASSAKHHLLLPALWTRCTWTLHPACGEEPPLPAVPPQEVAFQGPCAAVEQHNTVGRGPAGVRAALTSFCGLADTCLLVWEFSKSLKHKRVVKTFLPFYVLPLFFPSLPFLWAGT